LLQDSKFDIFKQHLKRECISTLISSYFSGDGRDILKEEVKTYLMAQSSTLNLTFFFIFHPHSNSLWVLPGTLLDGIIGSSGIEKGRQDQASFITLCIDY
jgi:hypothetical protein